MKITATYHQTTRDLFLVDAKSATMTSGQRKQAQDMGAKYVFKTKDIMTLPKYVQRALQFAGFTTWAKIGHTSFRSKTWGIK